MKTGGRSFLFRLSAFLWLLAPVNLFAASTRASDLVDDGAPAFTLLLVLGVLLIVFLVIRQFWLWYWKLNLIEAHLAELVSLQREAIKGKK